MQLKIGRQGCLSFLLGHLLSSWKKTYIHIDFSFSDKANDQTHGFNVVFIMPMQLIKLCFLQVLITFISPVNGIT